MTRRLKIARIGNSRGIRIPAETLERYRIHDSVVMEERSEGILLRPVGAFTPKLSWEETAREMAAASEDWGTWAATDADALADLEWKTSRVAERGPGYSTRKPRRKK
ncbi:MAG: AbrB/MazE/SpoVT family DNA-binding domain-containing protein [Gemmatimonadaceae bacterium]